MDFRGREETCFPIGLYLPAIPSSQFDEHGGLSGGGEEVAAISPPHFASALRQSRRRKFEDLLEGVKSNRSAIGARVLMRYKGKRQAQDVLGQSGFLSVGDRRLHFGLGMADSVDIDVRWPSGIAQSFKGVPSKRMVVIDEVKGIVQIQEFRT